MDTRPIKHDVTVGTKISSWVNNGHVIGVKKECDKWKLLYVVQWECGGVEYFTQKGFQHARLFTIYRENGPNGVAMTAMGMGQRRPNIPWPDLSMTLRHYRDKHVPESWWTQWKVITSFTIPNDPEWPESARGKDLGVIFQSIQAGDSCKDHYSEMIAMGMDLRFLFDRLERCGVDVRELRRQMQQVHHRTPNDDIDLMTKRARMDKLVDSNDETVGLVHQWSRGGFQGGVKSTISKLPWDSSPI